MVKSEMKLGVTTPSLGWPEWVFGIFIPIGGLFIIVRFTIWTIKVFKESKEVK
jgi:TRAP-type C4-dicarboxylate transport system permease small subunit